MVIDGFEPELQRFWAVWSTARAAAGGKVPVRRAITVSALRALTANCFVLERKPDGLFYFKMIGTGVEHMYGRQLTGCPISDAVTPEALERADRFFGKVLDLSCGGYSCDILTTKTGRKIRSSALTLPVTNDDGERVKTMTCCEIRGVGFDIRAVSEEETKATFREMEDVFYIDLGLSP
jgi:hypothetical protein